jgi:23S rRNA (guanosine2251-2'-O)-methyltransferase
MRSAGRAGGGAHRSDGDVLGGTQVEGRQAVRELLLARRRRVHQVLVSEATTGPLADLAELARTGGVPVHAVGRARLDAVATTDAHQGVVATAEPVTPVELEALMRPADGGRALLVVLDGVTDPHNLGAVLRSALCAGATGVVLARHRAAHLTAAAMKAAAGAVEHLPIAVVGGIPAALSTLNEAGVWTAGLDAGGTTSLWALDVATEPVALVLGAEGTGLSRLALARCEVTVQIPMLGPLASLNVSAAAALACFEVARRRGTPPTG